MKRCNHFLISLNLIFLGFSCGKDNTVATPGETVVKGKNRFTLTVDGAEREYYVHVPAGYTGNTPLPLVLMFHGTGQNGAQFYDISGWKEVGESQNILTVFPSSLSYCINDGGVTETTPKWTGYADSYSYCAGVVPKDDIKFMRALLNDLNAKLKVDEKRRYVVGFSNGGEFSARCAVEMSDVFAGAISSGGGGALPGNLNLTPVRLLPVMLEFGNKDGKLLKGLGVPGPLPMNFTTLFTTYPFIYANSPKPYITTFKLDEKNYTVSGDPSEYIVGNFTGLSGRPENVFKLVEVKDLEHEYPNGKNHPLNGAALHWAWLKQYSLP
ncbi:MAG: PHB depolymerase family esterase [Spirosomataceae bacterium]